MAVRLFDCTWCGHRLRFGSKVCGSCFRPTPVYNRRVFAVTLVGLVMVGTGAAVFGVAAPATSIGPLAAGGGE
jgi:hypothetical protein